MDFAVVLRGPAEGLWWVEHRGQEVLADGSVGDDSGEEGQMADGSVSLSFTRNCFQLNTLSWLDIGHYKIKPRVIYRLIFDHIQNHWQMLRVPFFFQAVAEILRMRYSQ